MVGTGFASRTDHWQPLLGAGQLIHPLRAIAFQLTIDTVCNTSAVAASNSR
jgi:hypothetical protein